MVTLELGFIESGTYLILGCLRVQFQREEHNNVRHVLHSLLRVQSVLSPQEPNQVVHTGLCLFVPLLGSSFRLKYWGLKCHFNLLRWLITVRIEAVLTITFQYQMKQMEFEPFKRLGFLSLSFTDEDVSKQNFCCFKKTNYTFSIT